METLPALVEPSPLILIQQALEAKIPAAELKGFFDLQVRAEQRRAEEVYAEAITAFQCEAPTIHKAKNVEGKYSYATYEKIMTTILPLLRRHKIVVTFDTAEADGKMQVTCRTRVGVVEKHTTVVLPVPPANKLTNETQTSVGAISYGKRTSLVAALNIICTEEDQDGQAPDELLTKDQQEEVDAMLEPAGYGQAGAYARFLAWVGSIQKCPVNSLADIRQSSLSKITDLLKRKATERPRKEGAA